MRLFKYLTPARVDIVEDCRIRFSPPESFNDPFECIPDSRLIENTAWQKNIEDASVRDLVAEEALRARIEGRSPRAVEDEIRRISREQYAVRLPQFKQLAQAALKAAREPLRLLCLSAVAPDDSDAFLMWGHYTQNHEGFVLEFDSEHAWFRDHLPKEPEPHDAGPVIYSDRRPGWQVGGDGGAEPIRAFVFTKSNHWKYEREYRLLHFTNTPGRDTSSSVDALFPIPASALIGVYFGVNAGEATRRRIHAACGRSELRHLRLFSTAMHPDEYRIEVNRH